MDDNKSLCDEKHAESVKDQEMPEYDWKQFILEDEYYDGDEDE